MKILVDNKWRDGFLDYHRGKTEYRIKVLAWRNLEKLEGVYFIHPKNIRMVLNYLSKIGPTALLRKIRSRLRERYRNEKYVSCGIGAIVESANETRLPCGTIVAFIAALHPPLVERIVLPEELISEIDKSGIQKIPENTLLYKPLENDRLKNRWWRDLSGWSIYSGKKISTDTRKKIAEGARECIRNTDWLNAQRIDIRNASAISEIKVGAKPSMSKKPKSKVKGVLFGYGHYAKTNILPNVKSYVDVDTIHEIDPTQIFSDDKTRSWDTSPYPRLKEKYDAFFIAGYHHTHSPLATYALEHNTYAVVEKPIATDNDDLKKLLTAMKTTRGGIFVAFHKRYSPLNNLAIEDLKVAPGDPISYHCIVYEMPQPPLYWYNWPNSKSSLVTNGCHWIDHFLYLNRWNEPTRFEVLSSENKVFNVSVELKNKALFTMVLTDKGSSYIGVQDYIELRADKATVRIINDSTYEAENNKGVIRRKKINKMEHYKAMYQQICRKILVKKGGDSENSIRTSAGLTLSLEEKIQKLRLNKA